MRIGNLRPSYLFRRMMQYRFQEHYPDAPWLTESAVRLLDSWLRPTDRGIEWGSGRSTLWLARRVQRLLSIEVDPQWYERVRKMLQDAGLAAKVDLRLVRCEQEYDEKTPDHPYVKVAGEWPEESADFVLVDGHMRLCCMWEGMRRLRPGGLLILDNANRFVPNLSLGAPATIHQPCLAPANEAWAELLQALAPWRAILTTDGIWDTRFWIKPG